MRRLNRQLTAGNAVLRPAPSRRQPAPADAAEPVAREPDAFVHYAALLWRQKWIVAACLLAALAAALAAIKLQQPSYRARLSLEVQNFNEDFLNRVKIDPTSVNYQSDSYLQTQLKMLESEALMDRVREKMRAQRTRRNPVELKEYLQTAAGTLKIRGSPMTRVIEIYAESPDPRFAADFVNLLAEEFIQKSLEDRWNSAQHVTQWLTAQLGGLSSKLQSAEARLNEYARESGLTDLGNEDASGAERNLEQLQAELFRAEAERMGKQSRYELARSSPEETLPEVLDDPTLGGYYAKRAELRRQGAELGAVFTPAHPQVKRVEAQVRELEAVLKERRNSILARVRHDYEAARRREQLVRSAYDAELKRASQQGSKRIQYNLLKREVDATRQLHESMLQRVKEAGMAAAMRVSNIRIVDPAKPPRQPYRPDRRYYLGLGLLGGGFLGLVLSISRERAGRTVRQPGELSVFVTELGAIPRATADPALARTRASGRALLSGGDSHAGLEMVTWRCETSCSAESYRSALSSILLFAEAQHGVRPQVILVTSPGPQEGKTTTLVNLAIAAAESLPDPDDKVIVVDCDFRRPRLHSIFRVPNERGVFDLLPDRGKSRPSACATDVPGLYVLPSGVASGRRSGLRYSARIGELIALLRNEFHTILIDTPPLLAFSDARLLGRWADAVVLVVRSGCTTLDGAVAAKQQLETAGIPVLGTILTDWDPRGSRGPYPAAYYQRPA